MIFDKSCTVSATKLKILNNELDYVNKCKYLGVVIDNKLKFNNHARYVINKVSKKNNYFNRISMNLSVWCRTSVYKSILAPHFEYCPTIMYYINESDKKELQVLQNRAMRTILRVNRYKSVKLMLDCLKFMSVKQRLVLKHFCLFLK